MVQAFAIGVAVVVVGVFLLAAAAAWFPSGKDGDE